MSSPPHRPAGEDDWDKFASTWGRVLVGVAVGVVGTLLVLKWTDKNDDVASSARDLKHSAENKGREIRDSWTR